MGYLFITEGLADPSITAAVDSTLIKAKGSIWHKSSIMKKVEAPCPVGIDTDAKWGIVMPRKDGYCDINYTSHRQHEIYYPYSSRDV